MKKLFAYGSICTLLCVGLATTALGQTVQGVIAGTVFDASGAVVPNATVTITNLGTNISDTRTTGAEGSYRFPLVPPGTYTVSVKAANFRESVRKGIIVDPSQTVSLNVTLEVGPSTQSVEVTAASPLVQTTSSDLANTVNNTTIMAMPLVSRNVYDLTFAAPQVALGMDFQPAAGGERESGTAYLLNGSDNNDNFSEGYANVQPPIESVGELSLITNNMSAQYGRGGGVVVSASQKSGTNKLHGALYEFNRNRDLNASDFFTNRASNPKPAYLRNQFGGEIDGPIKKDKSFFSFAYDQIEIHTGYDTSTSVPTPSELTALTAGAGPLAQAFLSKYPLESSSTLCPGEAGSAGVGYIGCASFFDPQTDPIRTYFGRFDQNFSEKDRLSVTINFYRENYFDKYGGGNPSTKPINLFAPSHYHNLAMVETHTFGPSVVNELTVAHNRHYSNYIEGTGTNFDPEVYIDGAQYGGWSYNLGPYNQSGLEDFTQDRWQLQDNASFVKGRHSFKFGGGWQHGIVYRNWDLGQPPYYEFANDIPQPVANFLPSAGDTIGAGVTTPSNYGQPECPDLVPTVVGTTVTAWTCSPSLRTADGGIAGISNYPDSNFEKDFPYYQSMAIDPRTGAVANAYRHYSMNDTYAFVQDDFKVTPHFTLNLGLRWDRYGAPTEQHGILAQFTNFNCLNSNSISYIDCVGNARTGPVASMWNTRNKDFGPRFGFAWDVFGNGHTSLRGGYGISYDRIFDNVWSNGAWNPPFYALINWDATASDTVFYTDPASPSPSYVPNSIPGPAGRVSIRTMENNLKDSSTQNFYLGVERQLKENFLLRVNWQGSMGRHLPVLMNYNRYDGMEYNPTDSTSNPGRPNSLYTGFNYRANNVSSNYNALVAEVQKRLSKGLQFQFGYTWSHLLDYGSDLFTGSTTQGNYSQPFYYVSNAEKQLEKGSGAFDHTHTFKLLFTYEIPFMTSQKGVLGKIAGGWQLTSFLQAYSGHPIEIALGGFNPTGSRSRYVARDANGHILHDANGNAENIGGDYNLDGVYNDHPDFVGTGNVYSSGSPADGIFTDNNIIGCGQAGMDPATANVAACNATYGVTTPNTLFVNPSGTGVRFGTLGRNVFRGPWYSELDSGLYKNFKLTERWKLQFRAEGINLINHPDFDNIDSNLNSSTFGRALSQANAPRRIQLGLRLSF